nr:immunoglobulin heavy chain junction region [Mus musculus]MBK4183745.1 immunoglobulin heavy chain junction region [Mus musculus]MBK4183746.1 immunoglobulin heavy chain junction region [Mus musculus]MBK4183747.1 immunoglobulin heavy chain junction region [Mus musculus]
CVREGSYFDYW